MISFKQLLLESGFYQYKALIRYSYNPDDPTLGSEKLAEIVRAIPGVTRVTTVSQDKEHYRVCFKTNVISQNPPKKVFLNLKNLTLKRFPDIFTNVELLPGSIETKNFIK